QVLFDRRPRQFCFPPGCRSFHARRKGRRPGRAPSPWAARAILTRPIRSSANPEPAPAPAQACPPSRQFVAVFSTTRALLNGPARCPCTLGEVVDFSGNLCFLCAEKDIKTI